MEFRIKKKYRADEDYDYSLILEHLSGGWFGGKLFGMWAFLELNVHRRTGDNKSEGDLIKELIDFAKRFEQSKEEAVISEFTVEGGKIAAIVNQ